jgi:hypothetical protein
MVTRIPRAEAYLLLGDRHAARRDLQTCVEPGLTEISGATVGTLLLWLRRGGLDLPELAGVVLDAPVRLGLAGCAVEAAAVWDESSMPYDAAWALLDGGTVDTVREAIARFDRIGTPAAARLARKALRDLGVDSVPAGARAATRSCRSAPCTTTCPPC